MGRFRGIEPIIAVVILIAVTIVIAIGVVGWIMGWWGAFGAVETIRVYPDSYIDATKNEVYLRIKNEGTASAVIYKIEAVGLGELNLAGDITVKPGEEITRTFSFKESGVRATAGVKYVVKLYTRAGNVISITLEAR